MIRSRLTIKTAWPWLLIIVVMVLGATLACLRASRPGRHADAHQDAAAGGRGRDRDAGTDSGAGDVPPPRRSRSRPRPLQPPQPRPRRPSPAPTQAEPSPTAPPAAPTPVVKADGSMASPDYGVQAFPVVAAGGC